MKTFIKPISIISIGLCLFSCKKTAIVATPSGAINVTNAVIGGATLTLTTSGIQLASATASTVSNNSYAWFPLSTGQPNVNLSVPAEAASGINPAVPAIVYYSQPLTVANAGNYSLFLSGTSPSTVDATLVTENYTHQYADSVCGIRFINLSPGSNPISVDIKGNANGSEVASLAYKEYSNFIRHPAAAVNTSYIFEFRDATTGNLITSYTLTTPQFHNVTLALRGIVGGSPAPGVILDKDY